jgi:AcrR family transcriptional regulator
MSDDSGAPVGLRELKKQRTRAAISATAIELFVRHGFDQVSITQVAEAAEVSRRTLFSYFPTKEDLVVHRFADHETEEARVLRTTPGPALRVLREHFLNGLRTRDPITGLTDSADVLALARLMVETPALSARMLAFRENGELALAEALQDTEHLPEVPARLAAAQISAVLWTLSMRNFINAANGRSAAEAEADALADAEQGFDLLSGGLAGLLG